MAQGHGHGGHSFIPYPPSTLKLPLLNSIMSPGVTIPERQVIIANNGCIYCCQFYIDHRQHNCDQPAPNGGPEYIKCTQAMADVVKAEMIWCSIPVYQPKSAYTMGLNTVAAVGGSLGYMY